MRNQKEMDNGFVSLMIEIEFQLSTAFGCCTFVKVLVYASNPRQVGKNSVSVPYCGICVQFCSYPIIYRHVAAPLPFFIFFFSFLKTVPRINSTTEKECRFTALGKRLQILTACPKLGMTICVGI